MYSWRFVWVIGTTLNAQLIYAALVGCLQIPSEQTNSTYNLYLSFIMLPSCYINVQNEN